MNPRHPRARARARSLLGCLLMLGLPKVAAATDVAKPAVVRHVLPDTEVRVMPRAANGRDYQLHVSLPASYATQPGKRYPVLYVCDAYWDFTLLHYIHGGLDYDKAIPEFIVVGFGYPGARPDYPSLRRYDYTPVSEPDPEGDRDGKGSGHAGDFLRVVEKEFIPFIEREYRVDGSFRALAGSSLGGLFAFYALFERPGLFQGIIAPSPATRYGNNWLFRRDAAFASKHKDLVARVFISGAGEEGPRLSSIRRFHEQLQSRRYVGMKLKWRLIDGERHAGTKPEAFNRGVRFVFAPLAPSPSEK